MLKPLSRFLAEQSAPESLRQLIAAVADACRDIGHAVNTSAIDGLTESGKTALAAAMRDVAPL